MKTRTYIYPFHFRVVFSLYMTEEFFVSEQITEGRFEALLDISDKCSSKLDFLAI